MQHIFRILRSAKELKRYYLAISAITVMVSLSALLNPIVSGWAIDEIRKGKTANVRYVAALALIIFLLDIASTFLNNIGGYLGDQMSARLDKILSVRYYEHLLKLPQRYFDTELTGKIISRLNRSIAQISTFTQMMSNNFLQFILTTIFSLAIVTYYSWEVALMLFILYPIYIWMTFRSSDTWQKYQAKRNANTDIANGRFIEAIGQIKVVKSFIKERQELAYFTKYYDKVVRIVRPQSRFWHRKDVERRLILNIVFLGVYMFIFVRAAQGLFTPGQAVALILLAQQIRFPIFTISFLMENTQRAIADSKDYFAVMDIKPHIADHKGAKEIQVKRGEIKFSAVAFAYDNVAVLKGVDLHIKADTKIALVGESGEGKTTITNLLLRLYEPQTGTITIDGQNINDVTQSSLRQSIGVVFQDPALFSGTIQENIAYANPAVSDEDVEAAARAANAHEFVEKLDKGYQTEIGERGLRLSGGQKQRIAIARALLKDAPILILDEATSSLDSKSEALVQEALQRLMRGRTTIIIAHRLSTIQNVDQIITLSGGKVDEVGAPGELAKTGGIYAQLLKLQQGHVTETTKKKLKAYDLS